MAEQYMSQLKELIAKSIDEQTKAFLRAFVVEFQGKFEQVLDLVEEFRTYLAYTSTPCFVHSPLFPLHFSPIDTTRYTVKGGDGQLDEHQAHIFLEKKGEAATVVEFREKMKQIDLDFNKRVSVIEYHVSELVQH
jgi:hypothetical protein